MRKGGRNPLIPKCSYNMYLVSTQTELVTENDVLL